MPNLKPLTTVGIPSKSLPNYSFNSRPILSWEHSAEITQYEVIFIEVYMHF